MTVKELIKKLLDFPMDVQVNFSISNEDTETTTYSYGSSGVQIFQEGFDESEPVRIHIEDGYEGSDGE